MSLTNIDDKLMGIETEMLENKPLDVPKPYEEPEEYSDDVEAVNITAPEPTEEPAEVEAEPEAEPTKDEYGSDIVKQEKVYTQAEVDARINEAIRKRLKERAEDIPQPQYQQAAQQQMPEYDPNNSDSWEVQLESFIENTLTKREQQKQQQDWQRQEQENQANFEIRFNQGMAKYSDFEQVVMGKPLTPQMVISTRGMADPAAFIYAAAKTQAPELDRISKIGDPYAQAIELGRLEERMRKSRNTTSQAPKPIAAPKGDVSEKAEKRTWSIDDKLVQTEQQMRKERMRGRNQ